MGNGIPFNMLCCNQNKETNKEDVDINHNTDGYNKNYKTIKITNNVKDEAQTKKIIKNNINKMPSLSIISDNEGEKPLQTQTIHKGDSLSHKDPNISLYNNTFQILNNTQQYITFSNLNFLKNHLINNNIFRSSYNSKVNSSIINFSKINSKQEFNLDDINTKLILSGELFLNKEIEIDKFGMKNSLRQKNDGVIIFGYKENKNLTYTALYDYIIDSRFEKIRNTPHHKKRKYSKIFEIILDKKEKVYYLYFAHNSLLLYYKIDDLLYFEYDKEYYLILGDIFLTVNAKRNFNSNEKYLHIEVEFEDEKPQKYIFEEKDLPIKIGRTDCIINIPKPSISKLHSTINFSNNMFFYKDEKSTNGTILLIKEDDFLKIKGEMNFKLEDIPFTIKEIIVDDK
jgi:hypothetical protein